MLAKVRSELFQAAHQTEPVLETSDLSPLAVSHPLSLHESEWMRGVWSVEGRCEDGFHGLMPIIYVCSFRILCHHEQPVVVVAFS